MNNIPPSTNTQLLTSVNNQITVSPLIVTKFLIPPHHPRLTSRPRLTDRLHQALDHKLTLLLAPAGFGKTTALSEWLHQIYDTGSTSNDSETGHFLWITLDEADNDPARFLAYLMGALKRHHLAPVDISLTPLETLAPDSWQIILTHMINHLQILSTKVVLVLDDYQVIHSATVNQLICFLLDNLPQPLHLVLASRVEPPLPLTELRTQGQLLMIEAADLRFQPSEVTNFLQRKMGLTLTGEEMTMLAHRTEGWIAGLQLAAVALQGIIKQSETDLSTISSQFIANFKGSHRYILDYLTTEVLRQQPPAVQRFLLRTAILDRLTAPLCDSLWTTDEEPINSQAMIEYLEQANLFIMPLDQERHWYRYHALFADFLRHQLKQRHPGQLFDLHRRAAEWYEIHDRPAEALTHALEGADVARANRLIQTTASRIFSRSEISALMSWLNALSDELQRSQPRLFLFQAWALLITGQFDRVEARLQEVLKALQTPYSAPFGSVSHKSSLAGLPGEVTAIRGTMAYVQRNIHQAVELYQQALKELAVDNLFLRGAVALNLGLAYGWLGEVKKASQALQKAEVLNQSTGNLYVASVAWWNLGQLQEEQGQLYHAAESYRQIGRLGNVAPSESLISLRQRSFSLEQPLRSDLSGAYVGQGRLLYERNQLAEAEQALQVGLNLAQQGTDSILITAYTSLAWLKGMQKDFSAASELIHQAETKLYREKIAPYWATQVAAMQTRLWLVQGNLEAANQWVNQHNLTPQALLDAVATSPAGTPEIYQQERDYLTLARFFLARQQKTDLTQAQQILNSLWQTAEATGRIGRLIEVLMLLALVHHAGGQVGEADEVLNRALSLAEPMKYIRLFVDEGQPMAALLNQVDSREVTAKYAHKLLTIFEPDILHSIREPLVEPLTDRELEILQLIEQGLSNKKIGQSLFLTTGTVKWHVSNLYSKLNVNNRTQAVARGRQLRLL